MKWDMKFDCPFFQCLCWASKKIPHMYGFCCGLLLSLISSINPCELQDFIKLLYTYVYIYISMILIYCWINNFKHGWIGLAWLDCIYMTMISIFSDIHCLSACIICMVYICSPVTLFHLNDTGRNTRIIVYQKIVFIWYQY